MTQTTPGVRAVLLIPVIALVAATVACSPQPPKATVSPTSSSSAITAPSATPTPTPATLVQAFGGNCATLLPAAILSADLGAAVKPLTGTLVDPSTYAPASLGGLDCSWDGVRGTDSEFMDVFALPTSALTVPAFRAQDCSSDEGFTQCYYNFVTSGYWFSGRAAGQQNASIASVKAATQKIVGQLTATASAAGSPAVATVFPGAWAKPVSCAALGTLTGVVAASGSPTLKPIELDGESDEPDGYYAALAASPYLGCAWTTNGTVAKGKLTGFLVQIAPGGAWAKQLLVPPNATPITIPGADSAFEIPHSESDFTFDVFKGSNWAEFGAYGNGATLAQLTPIAAAVVGGLG